MKAVVSFTDEAFAWLNPPVSTQEKVEKSLGEEPGAESEARSEGGGSEISPDGSSLTLTPHGFTDFWSRTFYSPLLIKSNAAGYLYPLPSPCHGEEATVAVDFSYTPVNQFDQAGLLVFVSPSHWMKCGIEFCDGLLRLSVVVCNEYSDWSTQPWSSAGVRLKVHTVAQSSSLVVEAAPLGSDHFHFIRIAHLHSVEGALWRVGPYAACPGQQKGCVATFSNLSIGPRQSTAHDPALA